MAPPRAAKNFQQRQPITTTLRTICQSYPSNTCLRELLQNADDAGATEIEYVLDTKHYNDRPILHDELSEYHGPALLARNNSVFTDKDFSSLSSVGDSGKRDDPASTGKFGQGFNSGWSSETGEPGGPTWDIVEDHDHLEIQNALKTFDSFSIDYGMECPETIIRIPLRTASQATASKIAKREITTQDIREALELFGQETREGGLLFLKHIRKVIIRIDDKTISTAQIVEDESVHTRERQEIPLDFRRLFVPSASQLTQEVSRSFEVEIQYSDLASSWTDKYLVQHTMTRSCGNKEVDDWARDLKLFSWVAIAAPLDVSSYQGNFSGRLFSTLRLPIITDQPVHIHGLFAIAPDRARLGFEDSAVKWNRFMFQERIAAAWAQLLVHRKSFSCYAEGFGLWPRADLLHSDLWAQLDAWTIDIVMQENMPVWNSMNGKCLRLSEGLFAKSDSHSAQYDSALARVHLPVVVIDEALLQKVTKGAVRHSKKLHMRTPSTVRWFLREKGSSMVTRDVSLAVLEYCLLDALHSELKGSARIELYVDLYDTSIWPTMDGALVAVQQGEPALLLPRDESELALFAGSRTAETLDPNKVTTKVRQLLGNDIFNMDGLLRHRTMMDLKQDWPAIYPVKSEVEASSGMAQRLQGSELLIRDIWIWMCSRLKEEKGKLPLLLHDLLLVPVVDTSIRRLGPGVACPPTLIIDKSEPLAGLIQNLASCTPLMTPPILDCGFLTVDAVKLMRKQVESGTGLRFACQDHLESLVDWLAAGKEMLAFMSPLQREELMKHLEILMRDQDYSNCSPIELTNQMKQLPIFKRSSAVAPFKERFITVCDLNDSNRLYNVAPDLPPLPDIPGLSFYDVSTASDKCIARQLSLFETISDEELLTRHFLPWMDKAQDVDLILAKDGLVEWIFKHSKSATNSWIMAVRSQPIVPLPCNNGPRTYGRLQDLIDPTTEHSRLYFEEENRFPCSAFFQKNKQALLSCGLGNGNTWSTPLERARYYAQCDFPIQTLSEKVGCLLKIPIEAQFSASKESVHELRTLKWLPGVSIKGKATLFAPAACRGADQTHLVDMVLGTIAYSVRRAWKKILGWDLNVPMDVLLKQLDFAIEQLQHDKVDRILEEINFEDYNLLSSKACILGSHRKYMTPQRVFLPYSKLESYTLTPYLDEVDHIFHLRHAKLLAELDVRQEPSVKDIQYLQESLTVSKETQLSETDLGIAISALEVATRLEYDPVYFTIPDRTSKLRSLQDIVHGDRNVGGDIAKFNFTHPRISEDLIRRLGIETSFARATRLEIDFEDEDEDEYTPREKLSTIISDTLGRYPIDTTFNEFLANADDAGATKISWTIDPCSDGPHSSQTLLTSDMQPSQGPALMVYNDEVFSEDDFAGFKEIGQGGKMADATTTGMFGRGAMSMYHFTDVPMIISGGFYLVLDPQQERLPRNKHYKHKTGVKISLPAIRRIAKDQLIPFEGLYGYDTSLDFYKGTIFRLPFRSPGKKTTLKDAQRHEDQWTAQTHLKEYFDTARISLLFLYNVNYIEFQIRGNEKPVWSISAQRTERAENEVFGQITISASHQELTPFIDVWRVGVMDIEHSPANVVKVGRGSSKVTECGIAACLRQAQLVLKQEENMIDRKMPVEGNAVTNLDQKVFCRLPMSVTSQLPISFHGSFAITGDRRTIAFEDQSDVGIWNQWLLTESLPNFYLDFLKDLTPRLGEETFNFWPTRPSSGLMKTLGSTIAEAFWKKIMDHDHVTYQLYPTIELDMSTDIQGANDLRRAKSRRTRRLCGVTAMSNAQFDFLPQKVSRTLRPLFVSMRISMVQPPPRMWKAIQDAASDVQLVELNSSFLAEMFRQDAHSQQLQNFLAQLNDEKDKIEAVKMLLEILIPITDGKDTKPLEVLDGCRVLPMLSIDAPLGLLTLNPQANSHRYLVATPEEQELFPFASDSMVNTRLCPRMGADIETTKGRRDVIVELTKAPFNVRKLEIADLGALIARAPTPSQIWIYLLWPYLNSKLRSPRLGELANKNTAAFVKEILSSGNLMDQPIYRSRSNGQWHFITPRQFEVEPCIVNPDSDQQHKMCELIPSLKRLDRICLPHLLAENEGNLGNIPSFARFLRALQKIELSTRVGTQVSLAGALNQEAKDCLRGLLTKHLKDVPVSENIAEKAVLRCLPVWPRLNRPGHSHLPRYLSAAEARFSKHSMMFMPWVKDLKNFVDPAIVEAEQNVLPRMAISMITAEQLWHCIKADLPTSVHSEPSRKQYFGFLRYLATRGLKVSGRIAPNGASLLCQPNSLYDHDDLIFDAAFRKEQSSHFLHINLQVASLRSFWLSAGLRTRPAAQIMSSEDFLECALAIDRQSKSNEISSTYVQDAKTVSAYLQYDRQEFLTWPQTSWDQISKVRMFRVQDDLSGQSTYRQARMGQIAYANTHCSLEEAVLVDYVSISWSQLKFLNGHTAAFAYAKPQSKGRPSTAIVYQHLEFLIGISKDVSSHDLENFIQDVQASYTHLQEDLGTAKHLPGIRDAKIWFNINTTQIDSVSNSDLQLNLTSASLLCLDSAVDPLPIRVALKFLIPYEKLLKALRCDAVVQPTTAPRVRPATIAAFPLSGSVSKIRKLREQSQLTDVIFKAEGREMPAHKIFLAAVSGWCETQFLGEWGRMLEHDPTITIEGVSFNTLSSMIEFAYTGEFVPPTLKDPTNNEQIADALDDVLDLLDGTSRWFLDSLHDFAEDFLVSPSISKNWIRPDNVVDVKERAESVSTRAPRLAKHCEEFIALNGGIVSRFVT